MICLPNCFT